MDGSIYRADLLRVDLGRRDKVYVHLQQDLGLRLHTGRHLVTYWSNFLNDTYAWDKVIKRKTTYGHCKFRYEWC
jgi:hypothetical protein